MDYSGASSYIYAKACGMLSRTFVGKNAEALFNAKSLSDLWTLFFSEPAPQVPEQMLANMLETEAVKKMIKEYIRLLECYSNPNPFLVELLRRYEVENLKVISAALSENELECPEIVDLGKYNTLDYSAWPNIKKITENSAFSWYNDVADEKNHQKMDFKLDLLEIQRLWKSVKSISDSSRKVIAEHYKNYYSVKNMLWALRLKVYYKMSREEIEKNLFYVSDKVSKNDPICGYAFEILDWDEDVYENWENWRFSKFLNPHEEGVVWKIDPVWIEQKTRIGEVKAMKRILHENPVTYASLFCFYILKETEINYVRAATEALRLNYDSRKAMEFSGIFAE